MGNVAYFNALTVRRAASPLHAPYAITVGHYRKNMLNRPRFAPHDAIVRSALQGPNQ